MRKKVFLQFVLICLAATVSVFAQKENAALVGFWTGAIEKDGKIWRGVKLKYYDAMVE